MTKFLFIRHALTDSVGIRLSGRTPGVHLNEAGFMQAERLANRLTGLPLKVIYSSPLERAMETATPLATKLRITCVPMDNFLEVDFGEWTNKAFKDIENEPGFQLFNSYRSVTRIPGGETMPEAQARFIKGVEQLYTLHPGQMVAIVSHADMIKAGIAYYAGIHLDMFQRLEVSPASVSIIEMYDETARVTLLNDTGEFDK